MTDLEQARRSLESEATTFALVRDGREMARGSRPGVRELLEAVARLGEATRGASLADKIVGRAVAFTAALAGIKAIYTPLGSDAALVVCTQYGITFEAGQVVPVIQNQRGDDLCPMEKLTAPLTTPEEAVRALREFVHLP